MDGRRNEELMTVADCARESRESHWTIRRRIERDELPAYRLGRGLRVKRSDWLAFLSRAMRPANALAIGNNAKVGTAADVAKVRRGEA